MENIAKSILIKNDHVVSRCTVYKQDERLTFIITHDYDETVLSEEETVAIVKAIKQLYYEATGKIMEA